MYGALPIGGKLLLTLNNYPEKDCDNKTPAYDWWTHYRFENLDKVVYYHLKTPELKKDLRQKISKYLKKDNEWQEYKRINKIRTSDDSYASDIWNKSVKTDNRFGTLRVILQRTR